MLPPLERGIEGDFRFHGNIISSFFQKAKHLPTIEYIYQKNQVQSIPDFQFVKRLLLPVESAVHEKQPS